MGGEVYVSVCVGHTHESLIECRVESSRLIALYPGDGDDAGDDAVVVVW